MLVGKQPTEKRNSDLKVLNTFRSLPDLGFSLVVSKSNLI